MTKNEMRAVRIVHEFFGNDAFTEMARKGGRTSRTTSGPTDARTPARTCR
jgi:hypothetical protein